MLTTSYPHKAKVQFFNHRFLLKINQLLGAFRKEILYVFSFFILLSIFFVSFYNKQSLHLKLNKFHTSFFDVFFKYFTYLGDGGLFGVVIVIFLFIKRKVAYAFMVSGVLTLLVVHLFKKILFKGTLRPSGFFGEENLHLVEGVKMAYLNSFPSGHTTTAFAVFTILCLYFSKCKSQYLWISLAILVGVSRVYLSQHYWMDIFVGSIFGVLIGFVSMSFFFKVKKVH